MGRSLIFLGVLLIIAAVIFMALAFGAAGENVTSQIFVPFACESGDTIRLQSRSSFSSSTGSGQTIDFYCVDAEGAEEDVTGTAILVIIVGFVSLLGTGILMTIIGAGILAKSVTQRFTSSLLSGQLPDNIQSSVIDLRDGGFSQYKGQIPQETQAEQTHGTGSLSDKLQQLEEAREQGLISRSEYERTRQAILDGIDD